jgi:hypothetical protein
LNRRARRGGSVASAAGMGRSLAALAACALLASCDTVDLGAPPDDINTCRPSQQFFIDQIWPNVLSQDYGGKHCYDSGCHATSTGHAPAFTPPPATEPAAIPLPPTWAANYLSATEQMNCADVSASNLILLPENLTPHGGGQLFKPASMQETLIRMWVSAP